MSDIPSTATEALRTYIQNEIDGYHFYKLAAERTSDQQGKKMLLSLANDELGHIVQLSSQLDSVLKTATWLSWEDISLKQAREGESNAVFPTDPQRVAAMIPEGADDLQALTVAIQMEKDTYEQYARSAAEATDDAALGFFKHLMDTELGHLRLLESSYTYLADSGSWYQEWERPIFEG
ncbi:MAG: ferritin family protein [Chloroflexi bacterium]|nr:ferritin family protein [Chloroflexota bacterium]